MKLQNLPFSLPSSEERIRISKDVQVDSEKLINRTKLFRDWLQCEDYLPNDVDEVLIKQFLYGCKGNLQTAKGKYEKYMVNRTKLKHFYEERTIKDEIISRWSYHRIMFAAPKLAPNGRRVMVFRLPTPENEHFDCVSCFKQVLMQLDLHLFNDENAGYEFVFDAGNFSMGILSKLNLTFTQQFFEVMFTILPFRVKAVHLVNTTPAMDVVLSLIMKVLSKKLKERFQHRKVEDLVKYIPEECLPDEYGGTAGQCEVVCDRYNDFLKSNTKWLKYTDGLKLRGDIPKNKMDLYSFQETSMNGTFRKLNLD